MTAQRDADIDVESLRKSVRRPLDIFLFVSVIFLFLTVAAMAAFVATVLKPPQVPAVQDRTESLQAAFKVGKEPLKFWIISLSRSCSQVLMLFSFLFFF